MPAMGHDAQLRSAAFGRVRELETRFGRTRVDFALQMRLLVGDYFPQAPARCQSPVEHRPLGSFRECIVPTWGTSHYLAGALSVGSPFFRAAQRAFIAADSLARPSDVIAPFFFGAAFAGAAFFDTVLVGAGDAFGFA